MEKLILKRIIIYAIILISVVVVAHYPNNKNILNTEKLDFKRSEDMEDLELIKQRIFDKNENTIMVFFADWCPHCKEFLPHFDNASQYVVTNKFNFWKINCQHKHICNDFNVNRYPTVKVFYSGVELEDEPGRDLESLLEYVNKLSTSSLVELKSGETIDNFKSNYGVSSFIIIYDSKESEFFKCIEKLAEQKFKTLFYFGLIEFNEFNKSSKSNCEISSNTVIFSDKHCIYKNWNNSCDNIENFLLENKFPLMRKLDSFYIKQLQRDNKTLIMAAVSTQNSIHMYFLENILHEISRKNRHYAFAYIDILQDQYLVNYFQINTNNLPKIIVYNFFERKFYVDNPIEDVYSNEETSLKHLNSLITQVNQNTLKWSTGNFMEDLLAKFGIVLNQTTMMYILGFCFGLIVIILLIVIFYCGEKNEEEERRRINETTNQNAQSTMNEKKNQ